jgi:hypothetical protein
LYEKPFNQMVSEYCINSSGVRVPKSQRNTWKCRNCNIEACGLCEAEKFEASNFCRKCFFQRRLTLVLVELSKLERQFVQGEMLPENTLYTRFTKTPLTVTNGELRFLICNNFLRMSRPLNDELSKREQRMPPVQTRRTLHL